MKKDLVQLVLAFLALVFGGALEDFLPKGLGVGWPFLLSATAYYAVRRTPLAGILFAIAAGATEDALAGLPAVLSIGFFTLLGGLLRGFKLSVFAALPAFCVYQIWLWIWLGSSLGGNIFSRLLVSLPVGALTLVVTVPVLSWLDGKAAVDET